jgi:hypothetical protein
MEGVLLGFILTGFLRIFGKLFWFGRVVGINAPTVLDSRKEKKSQIVVKRKGIEKIAIEEL